MLGGIVLGTAFGLSVLLVNHMTVERSHAQYRGRNLSYLTMAIFLGQFMASFMEFLPGEAITVFGFVAVLSLIFTILFYSAALVRGQNHGIQAVGRPKWR